MASKPKSRTSSSNLTKKAHVPIWAIALGVVVLVGLGAFFVFKSFASTSTESGTSVVTLYCYQGICYQERVAGGIAGQYEVRYAPQCRPTPYGKQWQYKSKKGTWLCVGYQG